MRRYVSRHQIAVDVYVDMAHFLKNTEVALVAQETFAPMDDCEQTERSRVQCAPMSKITSAQSPNLLMLIRKELMEHSSIGGAGSQMDWTTESNSTDQVPLGECHRA